MNILFLSLLNINSIDEENIYMDLLNEFIKKNNDVFIVSPIERRYNKNTHLLNFDNCKILKVKTGNIQKTNIIEKGISTLLIENQFKNAIKKYFNDVKFDLVLYATPPITFCNVIKYIKKRDNARTYLMLKDIFPQNAVDLKMFSKKSIFYKFFRKKEKTLYKMSDRIGCMSPKNKEYLIQHNSYLDENKIEVFPNSINIKKENYRNMELNKKYRKKYNIPNESKVFMYGGNLGKPQGIPFVIECLDKVKNLSDVYFIICGSGTEYKKLEGFKNNSNINNLLLLDGLPKKEYDELLNVADVGLIFLDYNFTIPNFPSRLLSYMEKGIPVLSCTDPNTDIGDIIESNNFGWKCYSNNSDIFKKIVLNISELDRNRIEKFGQNGYDFLKNNYLCKNTMQCILNSISKKTILVVDIAASTGGALSILRDYYEKAISNFDNEYIFLLSDNYLEETSNVEIVILKKYKKWINRLFFDYIVGKKVINSFNPDVVLSLQNTCVHGLNIKQILYVHQSIPFQELKKFSIFKYKEFKLAIIQYFIGCCIKSSIKKADRVIVQTNWMKRAILKQCKIGENKIDVVMPSLSLNNIVKAKNIDSTKFFYPTSDELYKNNELIYKAVKLLNDNGFYNFEIELTIDGISTKNIKKIGRIPREKVYKKYSNSILVFPSYIETFGLPLLEAKESGTIILASDTDFAHEVLSDYSKAYFFNPFDEYDLSRLMLKQILKKGRK